MSIFGRPTPEEMARAKATNQMLVELTRHITERMPDGKKKYCGQAMLLAQECIDALQYFSFAGGHCAMDEDTAKQTLVYLTAVKSGLDSFIAQHDLKGCVKDVDDC